MNENTRNTVIFVVVTMALLLVYQVFVLGPADKRRMAEQQQQQAAAAQQQQSGVAPNGQPVATTLTRDQALAAGPRVPIATADLTGSVSLTGAKLDDLFLTQYRQTATANSPPVELLRPFGADNAYYAVEGWVGQAAGLPDETTPWTQTSQGPLTDKNPLELAYTSPSGLAFHREIKVDAQYLFTVTDTVINQSAAAVNIAPFGSVQRRGIPDTLGKTAMEGAIGVFDKVLKESKYQDWKKNGAQDYPSTGGWTGVTDKYWMTIFAPPQNEAMHARIDVTQVNGVDDYQASYVGQPRVIPPGMQTTEVTHIFAGAKVVKTLNDYSSQLGVQGLDKAVDWGWFEILSKPVFLTLDFYAGLLANLHLGFGWAILALTITIRVLMFPFFNASYSMSTKMKKVQPEMKAIQERHKGDPQGQQKEMMALYAREKINPVTGCIPMLLPLPVFYALNNVFNVTIEMRHASFGWVNDLSAPDPTTVWNLFGLIPWDPSHTAAILWIEQVPFVGGIFSLVFHLGAWPIIYATTMWLSIQMAPPAPGADPTQMRIMKWMPWVFMIVLAQSAVGLVIYWSFSSIFTMAQQYVLMRRFKVENPIDAFFARLTGPKEAGKAP